MIDRSLSYSQMKRWLECRQAWAYQYRDGYRAKVGKQDFMRGSLIHLGMEHGLVDGLTEAAWIKTLAEWNREWKVDPDTWIGFEAFLAGCRLIIEGALDQFHRDWRVLYDDHGPLIERRFHVTVPGWKSLVFVPDVVVERRTGEWTGARFGLDFKSFGKPKPAFAGEVDLQGAIYQRGLAAAGIEVVGTVLYQVSAQPPKEPRVNKDGSTHKGDADAAARWKPVEAEILTVRSREFLDNVWGMVVVPLAAEIAAAQAGETTAAIVPRLDYYACSFCEFAGPCLARLKGHDEAATLADNYNRRASRQKGE